MILERVALTGKTQKPDRKIETRKDTKNIFFVLRRRCFLEGFQIYSEFSLTLSPHVRL